MNTDVLWPEPEWAEMQVLRIQTKKRSAGVDGIRPDAILSAEEEFLPRLREDLKARQFAPFARARADDPQTRQ